MSASMRASTPMTDGALAFLTQPAGRGMTVLIVGAALADLIAELRAATGATGIVVVAAPTPKPGTNAEVVYAAPTALPVRSHVADLVVLLADSLDDEIDAVAEEARRALAPGGLLRALARLEIAYRLLGELHTAGFRDAATLPLGGRHGIRARGPR